MKLPYPEMESASIKIFNSKSIALGGTIEGAFMLTLWDHLPNKINNITIICQCEHVCEGKAGAKKKSTGSGKKASVGGGKDNLVLYSKSQRSPVELFLPVMNSEVIMGERGDGENKKSLSDFSFPFLFYLPEHLKDKSNRWSVQAIINQKDGAGNEEANSNRYAIKLIKKFKVVEEEEQTASIEVKRSASEEYMLPPPPYSFYGAEYIKEFCMAAHEDASKELSMQLQSKTEQKDKDTNLHQYHRQLWSNRRQRRHHNRYMTRCTHGISNSDSDRNELSLVQRLYLAHTEQQEVNEKTEQSLLQRKRQANSRVSQRNPNSTNYQAM
eukprot:Nk52_evm24s160 gene=Nk52_evmTU24s160